MGENKAGWEEENVKCWIYPLWIFFSLFFFYFIFFIFYRPRKRKKGSDFKQDEIISLAIN